MLKQTFGVGVLGQMQIYNAFSLKIAECQVTWRMFWMNFHHHNDGSSCNAV
jgi:hypothetical protein